MVDPHAYRVPDGRPRSSPPDLASAPSASSSISLEEQIKQWDHLVKTAEKPCSAHVWVFQPEFCRWNFANRSITNRRFRHLKIKWYGQTMKDGGWQVTGETIIVERDTGIILNGYNRLKACIEYDAPFMSLVAFGIERKAFAVIDTGAGHTCGDAYRIAGVPHSALAAMATRWIAIYQSGNRYNRSMRWENVQSLDYYEGLNQETFWSLMPIAEEIAGNFNKLLPAGQLLAYLYVMSSSPRYDRIVHQFAAQLRDDRSSGKAIKLYLSSRRDAGTRFNENMRTIVLDVGIEATLKRARLSQQELAEAVANFQIKQQDDEE